MPEVVPGSLGAHFAYCATFASSVLVILVLLSCRGIAVRRRLRKAVVDVDGQVSLRCPTPSSWLVLSVREGLHDAYPRTPIAESGCTHGGLNTNVSILQFKRVDGECETRSA